MVFYVNASKRHVGDRLSHQGDQRRHLRRAAGLRRSDVRPQRRRALRRRASWRCRGRERMRVAAALLAGMRRRSSSAALVGDPVLAARAAGRADSVVDGDLRSQQGQLLRLTLASDQQYRLWTPLEEVAPEFVDALLLHEDRHFYRHPGFNPAALARAALSSYSGGAARRRLDDHDAARAAAVRTEHAHASAASCSRSRAPCSWSCATRSASCWKRTST